MAYHDAFWLVTGSSAPVVSLAVIVSLHGPARLSRSAETQVHKDRHPSYYTADGKPPSHAQQVIRIGGRAVFMFWSGLFNLVLQSALLAVSLISLDDTRNLVPPWLAVLGSVAGIVVLAVVSLAGALAEDQWQGMMRSSP